MQKRRKRAAPSDIYPACKISNTCPPDILNKAEQNTLADKILKYGSAGVFLGTLGIGTGRGTGGSTGYVPLGGSGVRVGTRVSTIRPSLPASSVGAADIIPVDAVNPLGPAVQPPEFPSVIEDPIPLQPPRFPSVVEEEIFTVPSSGTSGSTEEIPLVTPKVTVDEQPAILEVTPETREPRLITRTQYGNPTFEVNLTSSAGSGETSASDHILVQGFSGGHVVGEQIPLQDLAGSRSFSTTIEEETSFFTSTPTSRPVPPRPRLTGRRYQQVRVTDPRLVTDPRSLVVFSNPTFDESVDLIFDQDVEAALAAPSEDFRDVARLSGPIYSRNTEGGVRVSRIGQKATMKTRSGLRIGPQMHYFYDLSDITPAEEIELGPIGNFPLGEQSGESVISSGTGDFEIITLSDSTIDAYPDEFLLDEIESIGNDLQLIIGDRRARPISVPNLVKPSPQVFPEFEGVHVSHGGRDSRAPNIPITPHETPAILFDVFGSGENYFLHPSLLKRKKRKHSFL